MFSSSLRSATSRSIPASSGSGSAQARSPARGGGGRAPEGHLGLANLLARIAGSIGAMPERLSRSALPILFTSRLLDAILEDEAWIKYRMGVRSASNMGKEL